MDTLKIWDGTAFAHYYQLIDESPQLRSLAAMCMVDCTIYERTGIRPRFDPAPSEIRDTAHMLLRSVLEGNEDLMRQALECLDAWNKRSIQ